MLKCARSGMKIGMKMTMISVHSRGHPRMKMMACDSSMNSVGVMFSDSTHCSMICCPPSSANAAEKIDEPTNSQHTMAEVLAVRKTDSFTVGSMLTCGTASMHQIPIAAIDSQPTQSGGAVGSTPALNRMNPTTETPNSIHSGIQVVRRLRRCAAGLFSD